MKIQYVAVSPDPVLIFARPYTKAEKADGYAAHPSHPYKTGKGETTGWMPRRWSRWTLAHGKQLAEAICAARSRSREPSMCLWEKPTQIVEDKEQTHPDSQAPADQLLLHRQQGFIILLHLFQFFADFWFFAHRKFTRSGVRHIGAYRTNGGWTPPKNAHEMTRPNQIIKPNKPTT